MGLKGFFFGNRGSGSAEMNEALAGFYSGTLARWKDIYQGGGDWRYTRKGGMNGGMRRVASLGAARAICAEMARLCFTEGTELISADSETASYLKRVLDANGFSERFSDFLEKMFALGGGVIKIYRDKDGTKLDFVTADRFVPTKWDSRRIYGGTFGSPICANGRNYILAESQELTQDGLITENRLYHAGGGRASLADVFPEMTEKSVISGLENPLFVYFRAAAGQFAECAPLGASVFAGAEDTLKSLDIVFDSLSREFVLGKKRIIVPSYAVRGEYDTKGNLKRYFDVNDEVFEALSADDNDDLKISDNTATLRVSEHVNALGELLDLLCMQVGLSEGALSYKSGTINTATEVVSRNSRTYRTAGFYRKSIANCLAQVAENICLIGKMSGELSANAEASATIRFADGVCEDEGSKTDRAKSLYNAGLISRARALSEIYGISLESARAMEKEDFNGEL